MTQLNRKDALSLATWSSSACSIKALKIIELKALRQASFTGGQTGSYTV